MRTFCALAIFAVTCAGVLMADAKALIVVSKGIEGGNKEASSIASETLSGVDWMEARARPGRRLDVWEVVHVEYIASGMDDYNGIYRKNIPGQGERLYETAKAVKGGKQPAKLSADDWARVQLACSYFEARGKMLMGEYEEAIELFRDYIKEAEKAAGNVKDVAYDRASFKSKISGKTVAKAGALHRLYLDAMENLGECYVRAGDPNKATSEALDPIQDLCKALAGDSTKNEFFDWTLRALRLSAEVAVENAQKEDDKGLYKGAVEQWDKLEEMAKARYGGKETSVSSEASLKAGFAEIKAGDRRSARSRFFKAIKEWESGHKERGSAPTRDWLDPEFAYKVAGSYLGQGMVDAAEAIEDGDDIETWTEAMKNFSAALSVFVTDRELRSMILIEAAYASAKLAKLSEDKKVKKNYGDTAGHYLKELLTALKDTKAAGDTKRIKEIEKMAKG